MRLRRKTLQALTLASLAGSLSFCGGSEAPTQAPASAAGNGASGKSGGGASGAAAGAGNGAGGGGGGGAAGANVGGAPTGGSGAAGSGVAGSGAAAGGGQQGGKAGAPAAGAGGEAAGQSGASGQPGASGQSGASGQPGSSGGEGGAAGNAGAAGKAGSGAGGAAGMDPPNIIFVLADDFSWNLVEHMKNLKQMQADGVSFENYFVTDSLCCPSRSSIFTGKMPHNTGVFANVGSDGGYDTYLAKQNDLATFAVALTEAGYRTGMGGKFMNGYKVAGSAKPKGWNDIFMASNGYENFDYDLRQTGDMFTQNNDLVHYGKAPAAYLTDVLLKLSKQFIGDVKTKPFLLEIATFTPHAPFTPAPRHEGLFPNLEAPKAPSFNKKPSDAPPWLAKMPPLDAKELDNIEKNFKKRVRSVQAIDEMLGDLRDLVAKTPKLANNTYIVFSSDNGFHLGEHALRSGKMTAFSTDIRVPLIVVGPGVPAGKSVPQIAQNIDLCPTFAALGQTAPPPMADGRSLVPLLHGEAVTDWRDAGLVEHHHADPDPDDPDVSDPTDPPDYAALRTRKNLYVRYTASGVNELYDLEADPHELKNIAGSLTPKQLAHWQEWLKQARACKDSKSCWDALHEPLLRPDRLHPLAGLCLRNRSQMASRRHWGQV